MISCLFCNINEYVLENHLSYAIYDKFPVNPGHMLIIPKRHVENYFGLTDKEKVAMDELLIKCKSMIDRKYNPDGYNIGVNCGKYAGQTVFHVHVHLIPRYKGDIDNPQGGVRGVIPSRQSY